MHSEQLIAAMFYDQKGCFCDAATWKPVKLWQPKAILEASPERQSYQTILLQIQTTNTADVSTFHSLI